MNVRVIGPLSGTEKWDRAAADADLGLPERDVDGQNLVEAVEVVQSMYSDFWANAPTSLQ